jgi:low temperature requirement protein LtrA
VSNSPLYKKLSLSHSGVLRDRSDGGDVPVTNMELFFDLVYVFTIIQLSEHLYEHPTLIGALQTWVMFSAVWWGWNYTAWATGWIDPNKGRVVVMMCALMVLGIATASVIPDAFTDHGQMFAETYVAMQIVRNVFMVWAFSGEETRDGPMQRNYTQLLIWSVISGLAWNIGAFCHDSTVRLAVWAVAAALDVTAPMHGFWVPGMGSTPMKNWAVSGGHLAERCQLVLMIAFGETVLNIGKAYSETSETQWITVALITGFILSASLWTLYFLNHALAGAEKIEKASDEEVGMIGRSAYAYAHMAMVGAIIVLAVAIHMAIEHPTWDTNLKFTTICIGGPVLYLFGLALSKKWLGDEGIVACAVGIVAMVVLGAIASFGSRELEMFAAMLVALSLALWTQSRRYVRRPVARAG